MSDKEQLIVNLKSVGTGIDIRTGFTYPMLADGKGYDLNNCVHVTECDIEWLVELNHSDRLLLICCLDSIDYGKFFNEIDKRIQQLKDIRKAIKD